MTGEQSVIVSEAEDMIVIRPEEGGPGVPRATGRGLLHGAVAEVDVRDGALRLAVFDQGGASEWIGSVLGDAVADAVAAGPGEGVRITAEESPVADTLRRYLLGSWLRANWPGDVDTVLGGDEVVIPEPAIWLLDVELAVLADVLGPELGDREAATALLAPRLGVLAAALDDAARRSSPEDPISAVLHRAASLAEDLLGDGWISADSDGYDALEAALVRYEERSEGDDLPPEGSDAALDDLLVALAARVPRAARERARTMGGSGIPSFAPVDWSQVHPRQLSAADTAIEWRIDDEDGATTLALSVDVGRHSEREPIGEGELYARCRLSDGTTVSFALERRDEAFVGSVPIPPATVPARRGVTVFSGRFGTGEILSDVRERRAELLRLLVGRCDRARIGGTVERWDAPFAFERVLAATGYARG